MNLKELINEEIYGDTAVVYRYGDRNFPKYLSQHTYSSGLAAGNMYGKVYIVYMI